MTWMTIHNKVAVCGWSVSLSRQMSAILVGRYRWLHFWQLVLSLCYKCVRWLMGKESAKLSFGSRLQSLRPWYVYMCCFCLLHLSTCVCYISLCSISMYRWPNCKLLARRKSVEIRYQRSTCHLAYWSE